MVLNTPKKHPKNFRAPLARIVYIGIFTLSTDRPPLLSFSDFWDLLTWGWGWDISKHWVWLYRSRETCISKLRYKLWFSGTLIQNRTKGWVLGHPHFFYYVLKWLLFLLCSQVTIILIMFSSFNTTFRSYCRRAGCDWTGAEKLVFWFDGKINFLSVNINRAKLGMVRYGLGDLLPSSQLLENFVVKTSPPRVLFFCLFSQ